MPGNVDLKTAVAAAGMAVAAAAGGEVLTLLTPQRAYRMTMFAWSPAFRAIHAMPPKPTTAHSRSDASAALSFNVGDFTQSAQILFSRVEGEGF